jgi:hypothetical protein
MITATGMTIITQTTIIIHTTILTATTMYIMEEEGQYRQIPHMNPEEVQPLVVPVQCQQQPVQDRYLQHPEAEEVHLQLQHINRPKGSPIIPPAEEMQQVQLRTGEHTKIPIVPGHLFLPGQHRQHVKQEKPDHTLNLQELNVRRVSQIHTQIHNVLYHHQTTHTTDIQQTEHQLTPDLLLLSVHRLIVIHRNGLLPKGTIAQRPVVHRAAAAIAEAVHLAVVAIGVAQVALAAQALHVRAVVLAAAHIIHLQAQDDN